MQATARREAWIAKNCHCGTAALPLNRTRACVNYLTTSMASSATTAASRNTTPHTHICIPTGALASNTWSLLDALKFHPYRFFIQHTFMHVYRRRPRASARASTLLGTSDLRL